MLNNLQSLICHKTQQTKPNLYKYISMFYHCFYTLLYIDLWPSQTCHSKVMHRKEVTHSEGSYEKKSRRWAWLKKWDKVKIPWYSHRLMHWKRVTCESYSSFEGLCSDDRIVSAKICRSLRRNKKQIVKGSQYDLPSVSKSDIRNEYTVTVRSKFDIL